MPVLRHSSDGTPAAKRAQQTSFPEAMVQGATRSERIDALTEHPTDGTDGGEASQSVALISAVETEDGRLVVDSVAAGDSAQSREAAEARGAAASPTAATASGVAAVWQQAGGHAGGGVGSSTVGGAQSGPASSQESLDVAPPRRRGILQRLRLRPPPDVVSTDALPADVP